MTTGHSTIRVAMGVAIAVAAAASGVAGEPLERWTARDTLGELRDPSPDAEACLKEFAWKAGEFVVTCESAKAEAEFDRLVRFPSPLPSGDAVNDSVSMEWHRPKEADGRAKRAPAVIVVHESGSAMPAGRTIARGLSDRGVHALLIHLPYYGERRRGTPRPSAAKLGETLRQGIADVRRARDAVAVLPGIDPGHIGLQGTSLGGFVAATAGSLDGGFHSVFVMLAGADLFDIIQNGRQDVEKLRKQLDAAGIDEAKRKELLSLVEPLRVAHRLNPETTWLYSAIQDDVVPIRNARKLARAARLDRSHHIEMVAGHYTAAFYLPVVMDQIAKDVIRLAQEAAD